MLITSSCESWVCIEDFNDILSSNEKVRGKTFLVDRSCLKKFVDEMRVLDIGFMSCPFTWTNGRSGTANIRE